MRKLIVIHFTNTVRPTVKLILYRAGERGHSRSIKGWGSARQLELKCVVFGACPCLVSLQQIALPFVTVIKYD